MAEAAVAQAMREISLLSRVDVQGAFEAAYQSISPPVKPSAIKKAVVGLTKPEALLQAALLVAEPRGRGSSSSLDVPQIQHVYTYPDGTKASFLIEPKNDIIFDVDKGNLLENFLLNLVGPPPVPKSAPDTQEKALQDLLKAAAKCGIPQTRAAALADEGALASAIKAATTRQAVRAAFVNGTWQSAALTAVFDIKLLFDGKFQQYLTRIGVSGLHGGAVGGLSFWINHPFFQNNVVLSVLVGSSLSLVGLASTGDWQRFGKGLGVNIVSGASGWGCAALGALLLAPCGPLGPPVGGFLGGIAGGWVGAHVAGQVPALSGFTDHEVRIMYEATVEQLAQAGLKPDANLSHRQVVDAMMTASGGKGGDSVNPGLPFKVCMTDAMANDVGDLHKSLQTMYEASPDSFNKFLANLRLANAEYGQQAIS